MDHEKKSSQSSYPASDRPVGRPSLGQPSNGQTPLGQNQEASKIDSSKKNPAKAAPVYASALDEFFANLQANPRPSKPAPEAVAAAVQALQRFAVESDSEQAVNAVLETEPEGRRCVACGSQNPRQNTFCATCGVALLNVPAGEVELPPAKEVSALRPVVEPEGQHYYHHHYHHHYFDGEGSARNGGQDLRTTNAGLRDVGRGRAPQGVIASGGSSFDAASPTGTSLSRAESAVRKFTRDWAQACNTRHLDDLIDLYAVDAMVMRSNSPVVRGTAALREFFFAALDAGLGDVEFEPLRVELLGDVAYEAGRCKMLVPGVQGKRREERGKYLVILARQAGGEWKAVADSWSSDLSLADSGGAAMQDPGGLMRPPRKSA